jgi:hypothetical protein
MPRPGSFKAPAKVCGPSTLKCLRPSPGSGERPPGPPPGGGGDSPGRAWIAQQALCVPGTLPRSLEAGQGTAVASKFYECRDDLGGGRSGVGCGSPRPIRSPALSHRHLALAGNARISKCWPVASVGRWRGLGLGSGEGFLGQEDDPEGCEPRAGSSVDEQAMDWSKQRH